jgi:hypothetical protein
MKAARSKATGKYKKTAKPSKPLPTASQRFAPLRGAKPSQGVTLPLEPRTTKVAIEPKREGRIDRPEAKQYRQRQAGENWEPISGIDG